MLHYTDAGFQVMGVIGGNGQSPGCAVHHAVADEPLSTLTADSDLLMTALKREFEHHGLRVPILALRDVNKENLTTDLQLLQLLLDPLP